MSGTDYTVFQVGGTVLPLPASTANTLLQDADPALARVLAFLCSVVRTYLAARWSPELVAAGLPDGDIIKMAVPYDVLPVLLEAQYQFPLLALYRTEATYAEHTVGKHRITDAWAFDYILPPLSPGQLQRLHPIFTAIERIVLDRTMLGFDPAFNGGANIYDGIDSFALKKREILTIDARKSFTDRDPTFRLLHIEFEVKEQQEPNYTSFEALVGVDAHVSPEALPVTDFTIDNP